MRISSVRVYILVVLFFLLLSIFGCTNETPVQPKARYRFGDKVFVANGFFKACKGRITDIQWVYYINSYRYDVDSTCFSVDGAYSLKRSLTVDEGDLLDDAS